MDHRATVLASLLSFAMQRSEETEAHGRGACSVFHVIMFTIIYRTRQSNGIQFFFLCFICELKCLRARRSPLTVPSLTLSLVPPPDGFVRMTETMNTWAASNWRLFSSQNYFDKNGVFMCTLVSVPLLFMAAFMAVSSVYQCGGLLIHVKKKELAHKMRQTAKGVKDGEGAAAQLLEGKKEK